MDPPESPTRLFHGIRSLVAGPTATPGEMQVLEDAAMLVVDGRVRWLGERSAWSQRQEAAVERPDETIDLGGRVVVPGLVDPHTHAVWAGDRLADFEARTSGRSYQAILAAGGGIRSSVRHTSAATVDELVQGALPRLRALRDSGATTIEVKSGYGDTPAAELRMLEAVRVLQASQPARLVPTLLFHLPPPVADARADYLETAVRELIPEVAARGLATSVDVFVEEDAFGVAEAGRLLSAAAEQGLGTKLHADQFNSFGAVELAVEHGAWSVDHLEASGPKQVAALAGASTVATVLPGVSLHLGLPAAPGRALLDAGATVAVGTDLNPGSSPLFSSAMAMALAVRLNGLRPAEAMLAATVHAAKALGLQDRGRLTPGALADFLVLDHHAHDWRMLVYAMAAPCVAEVFVGGVRTYDGQDDELPKRERR